MITLLAKTDPLLIKLLSLGKQVIGRNVNTTIDKRRLDKVIPKYMAILADVMGADYDLSDLCLHADFYHLTFGIVLDEDTYNELLEHRSLHMIATCTTKSRLLLAIVDGSLRNWRDAIIDGSGLKVSTELRTIFNEIYNLLCTEEGLSGLWSDYSKKKNIADGTLLLEPQ